MRISDWSSDVCSSDLAGKVMAIIGSIRGGRDNDPEFFTRMRGQGPWAELIRTRFRLACKRYGLANERIVLRTDLFCPPAGAQGELFCRSGGEAPPDPDTADGPDIARTRSPQPQEQPGNIVTDGNRPAAHQAPTP